MRRNVFLNGRVSGPVSVQRRRAGQLLDDLSGGRAPLGQQHQEVVDDIGRFLDDAAGVCPSGLVVEGGGGQLGGLFDQLAPGGAALSSGR